MADTGLRVATQAIAWSNQNIAKGEVRVTADAAVTANPQFFTTLDNADADIPRGKYAWVRIRG